MKRILDVTISFTALILLSPLFFLIALALICVAGSPVLFRQERPGFKGRPFTIFKFRTMHQAETRVESPMSDEIRLHRLGRFLRSSSLDELPELWNVLCGDMSLVGPRPLLMKYLPLYNAKQNRRHEVRPGITGWAQIHGRNAVSWEERFDLDIWYVDHRSLWLDLKILCITFLKVLSREGISAEGHSTIPEFPGNMKQSRPDEEIQENKDN